jgi:type II secretory pathway pseudopilin PulG
MLIGSKLRGDTMIEVLFAVTIFSMVAIGGLTIMNQGAAAAQRSLEVSQVRHQIDTQAELLRMVYDEMIAERTLGGSGDATVLWASIRSKVGAITTTGDFSSNALSSGQCQLPKDGTRPFIMSPRTGKMVALSDSNSARASIYAQVREPVGSVYSEGMWIEATGQGATVNNVGYIDFYIRACWDTVGQAMPVTLGTIVRLYDPKQ